MSKGRKKDYIQNDVYNESLKRIRYLFDSFDKVVVSFSGGKDSTVVLNLSLQVAKEKNKLPLHVVFFDEEAIHPTTIEYVERVKNVTSVKLDWYCLEFKHRNACSNEEPYWFTWDKDKKDLWIRNIPEFGITEHKNFKKGMSFQEFCPLLFDKSFGKVAMLTGIRTQESLRRLQVLLSKTNDNYITSKAEKNSNMYRAHPIYDWSSEDVWLVVNKYGWDYNKTYDIFNKTKLFNNFLTQRVCPPFGEEPLRGLWIYSECFPEMWHKMLNRCKGVATAWRYGNTELYSSAKEKPDNISYKEYLNIIIDSYDFDYQQQLKQNINKYIKAHYNKTNNPIHETESHPISGISWKFLAKVALRGDFKGRQQNQLSREALATQNKLKLSKDDIMKIYGK